MSAAIARVLLQRPNKGRFPLGSSRSLHQYGRNNLIYPSRLSAPHCNQQKHPWSIQQRRNYLFLPSDWSELTYRWRLFWDRVTPTKVKLRLQFGKNQLQRERSKLTNRYLTQKSRLEARYATAQRKMNASYQFQKLRFKRRYRLQRDYFRRRYAQRHGRIENFRQSFQQQRQEFSKLTNCIQLPFLALHVDFTFLACRYTNTPLFILTLTLSFSSL